MTGRPRILEEHPDKIDELCELLGEGIPQSAAAPSVGISRAALMGWKAKGREARQRLMDGADSEPNDDLFLDFLDRVEAARAEAEVRFARYVSQAAAGGDVRAAMWWLDRARPERWAQRQRHETSGEDGEPIRIKLIWGNGEARRGDPQ